MATNANQSWGAKNAIGLAKGDSTIQPTTQRACQLVACPKLRIWMIGRTPSALLDKEVTLIVQGMKAIYGFLIGL